jgi:hypothetical protein
MGFFSGIGSMFSSAADWVGSAVSSAASWAGSALSTMVKTGGGLLGALGGMAGNLLKGLGIFGSDDPDVPEWGDRAMQAEEQKIFPDQFENFDDYMEKLRNFDLDPEKSKESNVEEKTFKGLEVSGRALEDKFNSPEGSMSNVFLLAGSNPDYFTSERFRSLLESGINISEISDYFCGRSGGAESLKIEDELVNNDLKLNPGKDLQSSRDELLQAVKTSQEELRNILE